MAHPDGHSLCRACRANPHPDQAVAAAAASQATTTIVTLQQFWEYRFEVPASTTLTIRLLKGLAEKDGTELAPNTPYVFTRTKSKINTWHSCELEVSSPDPGAYHGHVASPAAHETNMVPYLNLHMSLDGMRAHARQSLESAPARDPGAMGPRVLVAGPPSSGKTTLVKTLTAWATRMGAQPMVVNTDPAQGMLSLPGTLSAAVFATLMDITTEWGGTPNSGPTAIPVKLPLAYYYGLARPEDNPQLYRSQLSRLAVAATGRLAEDHAVRAAGMLIDAGGLDADQGSYDFLAHIVAEYSVNIIVTLGSDRMRDDLAKRFSGQRTTLGEDISIVGLDKCGGAVDRNPTFMQGVTEAAVKEYFFGDARRSLNPHTQQISFEAVSIWKVVEGPFFPAMRPF